MVRFVAIFLAGFAAALSFPVLAAAEPIEDTEPPKLLDLSIEPDEVDTTDSYKTVTFTAHVTDDLSGVGLVQVSLVSPSHAVQLPVELNRVSGTELDATYQGNAYIPRFSESGPWKIEYFRLRDLTRNEVYLNSGQLEAAGLPETVQVTSTADTEPPKLLDLSIEPDEVDTTDSYKTVTFTAHVTDDLSGVGLVQVSLVSPSHAVQLPVELNRVSGTELDATYQGNAYIPRFSESGPWKIEYFRLRDLTRNEVYLNSGQLEAAGLPETVQVTSTADTEPPKLLDLSIEPDEVDTTDSYKTVTFTAHVTDDLSGVGLVQVSLVSPSHAVQLPVELNRVSGTELDATYQGNAYIPRFSESGPWKIEYFRLRDLTRNEVYLNSGQLEAAGLPDTVQVNTTTPQVLQVSPDSGPEAGATEVQISGAGFSSATEVDFGSASATSFTVDSPASITATAPPGAGTVDVTVTTPAGTSQATPADLFRYSPPISLTSNHNPSVRGQSVIFTAKVVPEAEGAPTPEGTVAFVEGSEALGVASLNANGVARFTAKSLEVGEHPVHAEYSGDGDFGPAESPGVIQIVEKASTELILKSSRNPAPYDSSTTLSATVKVLRPGGGTPGGSVTFLEGGSPVATVSLEGKKVAHYSLKGLPVGSHEFQATFSGDENYVPSESAPLVQTIEKASTELILKSSRNPAPYDSSTTLSATVKVLRPGGGTPGGSVTFLEGGSPVATVSLEGKKVAHYLLKGLPVGSHEFQATFSGDENYVPSESAPLVQTITP